MVTRMKRLQAYIYRANGTAVNQRGGTGMADLWSTHAYDWMGRDVQVGAVVPLRLEGSDIMCTVIATDDVSAIVQQVK